MAVRSASIGGGGLAQFEEVLAAPSDAVSAGTELKRANENVESSVEQCRSWRPPLQIDKPCSV
jgi:hypothetical protein